MRVGGYGRFGEIPAEDRRATRGFRTEVRLCNTTPRLLLAREDVVFL